MVRNRITWKEMKEKYPNEWLLITDFELDEYGKVKIGVVERHSKKKKEAANPPIIDRDTSFCYTGESTFAGLRSHATHDHTL